MLPDDSYVILTNSAMKHSMFLDPDLRLPCKYYYAKGIFPGKSPWIRILLIEWLLVPLIVIKCLSVIRKEKVKEILVHPIMGNYLLTAYLVHKIARVPLYLYMFDLFEENNIRYIQRILAKLVERMAMYAATNIFVMSEALQEHYIKKYERKTVLLPHPVDLESLGIQKEHKERSKEKHRILLTSGMIYDAHVDAIVNLVRAIKEIPKIEFHIYTLNTEEYLKKLGITGSNVVYRGYVDSENVISMIQEQADILFLPMAFNSPYPELIKTASPVKLPEYLGSGVPIIVHAPPYAYVSWYARKYGWGLVVDKPDTRQLKEGLMKLINDKKLQQDLVNNARKTVLLHDSNRVLGIFTKGLGMTL